MIVQRNLPRIVIADDHTLFAEACKGLLNSDYEVVGTVSDGRSLVQAAVELRPDLIIVDISMPLLNGLDAGHQIKELLPTVKLLFLTMRQDVELAAEAFRRRASGYLLKSCTASELAFAIGEILCGKSYLSPRIDKNTVDFLVRQDRTLADGVRLTKRQLEVLPLLVEGKRIKEVTSALNMKPRTVTSHKYRIRKAFRTQSKC